MNNRGIIYYWGQFECGKFILFQNGFHILNWSQQFDFTLLGCPAHLHLVSISSQCDVVQWLMNIMKTSSVSMNFLVLFHVLCFIYADKIFLKDLFILTSKQIGIIYKYLYLFKRQESSKLWYSKKKDELTEDLKSRVCVQFNLWVVLQDQLRSS